MKVVADDLVIGGLYTVLSNNPIELQQEQHNMGDQIIVASRIANDYSWHGSILLLCSIELPYCSMRHFSSSGASQVIIDVRRNNLQTISLDYATSVLLDSHELTADFIKFRELLFEKNKQKMIDDSIISQNKESESNV